MGNLIFVLIVFGVGFWLGRKTAPKPHEREPRVSRPISLSERQRHKVMYASDADRIRELNTLSAKEGAFFTALKREFSDKSVVIKQKRFFIVDSDGYPLAIFEFRDGTKPLRADDIEDGLPVFMYKGTMAVEAIREDKQRITEMSKR